MFYGYLNWMSTLKLKAKFVVFTATSNFRLMITYVSWNLHWWLAIIFKIQTASASWLVHNLKLCTFFSPRQERLWSQNYWLVEMLLMQFSYSFFHGEFDTNATFSVMSTQCLANLMTHPTNSVLSVTALFCNLIKRNARTDIMSCIEIMTA